MSSITLFHYIVSYSSSLVMVILSFLMLSINIPISDKWKPFRNSRNFLTMAYALVAINGYISIFLESDFESSVLIITRFILLITVISQLLLFTATYLVFIDSPRAKKRVVIQNVIPIVVLCMILVVIYLFKPLIAIYTGVGIFLVQFSYYFYIFRREYKRYIKRIEEYYDENEETKVKWIQNNFYISVAFPFIAMLIVAIPSNYVYYGVFSILCTIFYSYLLAQTFRYRTNAVFLTKVKNTAKPQFDESETGSYNYIELALNEWVDDKKYLDNNIGIDELVASFNVSRKHFTQYFTMVKHTTFRSWRMDLRLNEAIEIIQENPDLSVSKLHILAGCSDRGNFHRQFKQKFGLTPTEYKNSINSNI